MSVIDPARVSGERDGPSRPGRPPVRLMALVVLGTVVSVCLWQWRSPSAFGEHGSEVFMYNQVGTTALFGVATPRHDMDPAVLTVHSVEPLVAEGSAELDVLVCRPRPAAGGIGAARGERALDRFCQSHDAAEDAQVVPGDDLILRVRSEEPGRVVIDGIKVTYSHGWRRGSEVTGLTVKATFGSETVREHLDGR